MSHHTAAPTVPFTTPLVLLGTWHLYSEVIVQLHHVGFPVLLLPEPPPHLSPCMLLVASVDTTTAMALCQQLATQQGIPWIAYCPAELIPPAYQHGAANVFPTTMPAKDVAQTIHALLARLTRIAPSASTITNSRTYQQGEFISLNATEVLMVESGIIALTALHEDGHQVLLGLSGAGQWIVGHPTDSCYLQLMAHTNASVSVKGWDMVRTAPDTPVRLRDGIRQREAWASAQARPSVEARLLGILGLLGEQFGQVHEDGILLNVKLTHQQLASAVGAARTTVSRLLANLRRRALLKSVQSGNISHLWLSKTVLSPHIH